MPQGIIGPKTKTDKTNKKNEDNQMISVLVVVFS